MNRIIALSKAILKNNTNFFSNFASHKKEKKATNKKNSLFILILICFLFVAITMFFTAYNALILAKYNIEGQTNVIDWNYVESLLTIAIPFLFLFLFLFLNTLVASIFFLSNDNKLLLSLPVKPFEIFIARFICCLITAYFLELVFIVPLNIAYLFVINHGFFIIINQILYFICFPFLPIVITFFITLLIDKIIHIRQHRQFFAIFYPLLTILGIILLDIGMEKLVPSDMVFDDITSIESIKLSIISLSDSLSFLKPISQFISKGFINNNFPGLLTSLLFFLLSLVIIYLASIIANTFYQKSMLCDDDNKRKKRKTSDQVKIKSKKTTYKMMYLKKDYKMIFRSPTAIMNLLLPPIIFIVVFAISIGTVYFSSDQGIEDFNATIAFVQSFISFDNPLFPFVLSCLSLILSIMLLVSATSISREGKNAYLMKIIPIKASTQIHLKMIPGISFSSFLFLILTISYSILFKLKWYYILASMMIMMLWSIVANYFMILIDLSKPFLSWDNEVSAIKQNRSSIVSMLVIFGVIILLIIIGLLLYITTNITGIIPFIVLIIISLILITLMEGYIQKKQEKILNNIE